MSDFSSSGAGVNGGMLCKARFVTPDDFLNYSGIDLRSNMRSSGTPNDSSEADRFLFRMETDFLSHVEEISFWNYDWDTIVYHPDNLYWLKIALLKQALYVYRGGDLSTDNGYDPQRGPIDNLDDINTRIFSSVALEIMHSHSLFSRSVKNMRRFPKNWF